MGAKAFISLDFPQHLIILYSEIAALLCFNIEFLSSDIISFTFVMLLQHSVLQLLFLQQCGIS